MSNPDLQSHIEFYKHLSGLSLATFAGCITLFGVFDHSHWLLLVACYSALASTFQCLYTIKVILTEGRIPYTKPGPVTGKFGLYAPYKLLLLSLAIVGIVVAYAASESVVNNVDSPSQTASKK
jgi:hypothetical protein